MSFAHQVSLALTLDDQNLAKEVYHLAENLPSLVTREQFSLEGFQLNGPMFDGSNLTTAYRGLGVFLVKPLAPAERERILNFSSAIETAEICCRDDDDVAVAWGPSLKDFTVIHRHIIPYKLWDASSSPSRSFMVMPRLVSTLEPMNKLLPEHTCELFAHVSSALKFMHSMQMVHGDVKPANIGLRDGSDARFVLIDLGSVQSFGERVAATLPYVPKELHRQNETVTASDMVDWWMFAVTLAEKCCGEHCFTVGVGRWSTTAPPRDEIRERLSSHLPAVVWDSLSDLLEGGAS